MDSGSFTVDKRQQASSPPAQRRRTSLTSQVGRLSEGDLVRLNRALLVFLGLAV
jgi:hypothetical protein